MAVNSLQCHTEHSNGLRGLAAAHDLLLWDNGFITLA